jgi:transketolase
MSVGIAMAGLWRAQHFNRPGFDLFNYRVFALLSDGDIMEGISSEAASLAGHLKLGNLCWMYDNNHISIEGSTALALDEDVGARFQAYGWNVLHVADANDTARIDAALGSATSVTDRPTLIIVTSHIAYGAPHKHDTKEAHGEPLGEEEIRGAKRAYGWPQDATFLVPDGVKERFAQGMGARGRELRAQWEELIARYRETYPNDAQALETMRARELPAGWENAIVSFPADDKGTATRDSAGAVLNGLAQKVPWLLGGAADLAPSTKTNLKGFDDFEAGHFDGRNLHFGIREHAMGAAVNGLTISGIRAYGATFLIFSDYMRPALRLSALMEIPSVWVYTHDSIGLGEDGPTHQPIEQLMSLRAIPGMLVIRPCDANEAAEAWRVIMALKDRPACLVLSRQKLPTLDRSRYGSAKGLARGGYVLADPPSGTPQVILIGTGSEIQIALAAHDSLSRSGVRSRVVSMPSWELFDAQDDTYRDSMLPAGLEARVSVEAGAILGWEHYVGRYGARVGMHSFGASAPAADVYKKFGITAEAVERAAREQIVGKRSKS